jgi:hypothetical protein
LAAIEFLPDSSEESGLSGDEETAISSHSNSTSGLCKCEVSDDCSNCFVNEIR